jgi:hypothetical protein
VTRRPDGTVTVRLSTTKEGRGAEPYFERTFRPEETREIRLYLRGGDDTLVIRGNVERSIRLRVVGGGGDDLLADSSRVRTVKTKAAFYDDRGGNEFVTGPNTSVDTSAYEAPDLPRNVFSIPPRDWGSSSSWFWPWLDYRGNVGGLVIGGGPTYTRYGFRQRPYAYRVGTRGMVAPASGRAGVAFAGDFRRVGSTEFLTVRAHASQLEAFRFHGFGNQTPFEEPSDRFIVPRTELLLEAMYHLPLAERVRLSLGPVFRWTDPDLDPGTPIERLRPYGSGPFGQAGARTELVVDTRDAPSFPTRGIRVEVSGAAYPRAGGAKEPFGSTQAEVRGYARVPVLSGPVLAVRIGGQQVLGRFPVHEAAFLGGSATVRGYPYQRFAGDALLYANSELRVPLIEANLVVRGTLGGSLLADAGRVYFDGESDGGWHTATGASVWFATPGPTVSLSYARGEVGQLYLKLGMPF